MPNPPDLKSDGKLTLKTAKDMAEVRAEIDRLDRDIVPLLLERLHYIKEAGRIKPTRDAVRDEWRIEDVVSKARATSDDLDGNSDFVELIYRHLIESSIAFEFTVYDALESDKD